MDEKKGDRCVLLAGLSDELEAFRRTLADNELYCAEMLAEREQAKAALREATAETIGMLAERNAAHHIAEEIADERDAALAEIERLHKALVKIASEPTLSAWTANQFREIAVAALEARHE